MLLLQYKITRLDIFVKQDVYKTYKNMYDLYMLYKQPTVSNGEYRVSIHSLKLKKEIRTLTKLEDGWDGYRGRAVSMQNACFALKILHGVGLGEIPVVIVPGLSGNLQLEWYKDSIEIDLHIISPDNVLLGTRFIEVVEITDADIVGIQSRVKILLKGTVGEVT